MIWPSTELKNSLDIFWPRLERKRSEEQLVILIAQIYVTDYGFFLDGYHFDISPRYPILLFKEASIPVMRQEKKSYQLRGQTGSRPRGEMWGGIYIMLIYSSS